MKLTIYKKALPLLLAFTLMPTGCTTIEEQKKETTITNEQTEQTKEKLKIEIYQMDYNIPSLDIIKEIVAEENSVIVYQPYTDEIEQIINTEKNIETQIEITREWNQMIFDQIWSLDQEQQVYVTSMKEINQNSKEFNQMIQKLSSNYPNIIYVNTNQNEVNDSIEENYESNKVALKIIKENVIKWAEKGATAVQEFDIEQTYETVKTELQEIDKQKILDGLEKANNYITSTQWYPWLEQKSNQIKYYLEPKIENAYDKSKPYIDEAIDKAKEIGSDANEVAKQKLKNWLNS